MLTLVPAYTDYNSQDEAKKGFHNGNDFLVRDISSKYDGKHVDKDDLLEFSDYEVVKVRYNDLRDSVFVNVEGEFDVGDSGDGITYKDEPHKLDTDETLDYWGYDSINAVMKENMTGRMIGVPAMCSEGCKVEPDGECPHGFPSILRGNALI